MIGTMTRKERVMKNRTLIVFISILLMFVILAVSKLDSRMRATHNSLLVTPGQLDSALVEAAYRVMRERDSVMRDCAEKFGPLNQWCP